MSARNQMAIERKDGCYEVITIDQIAYDGYVCGSYGKYDTQEQAENAVEHLRNKGIAACIVEVEE